MFFRYETLRWLKLSQWLTERVTNVIVSTFFRPHIRIQGNPYIWRKIRGILFSYPDVRLKVYKMAAVGCLERDRGKETTTKDGVQGLDFRRKSGVNRSFCFDDKSKECLSSNGGFIDKLCRLNGSMKTSSFIEPSMPTLRSRGDRRSECMRKRRLSKSEKEDA